MKMSVSLIMGFHKAADTIVAHYQKQLEASAPNSPERKELAEVVSAVETVKRVADLLTTVEIQVKGQ